MTVETHGYRLVNSKRHAGELITRVPLSYLRWMVQAGHTEALYAEAELERRGAVLPELEVSAHAVDRASLRVLPLWYATRRNGEGLYRWLCRVTEGALARGARTGGKVRFAGMKLVIGEDECWPVLGSVMPASRDLPRTVEAAVADLGAADPREEPSVASLTAELWAWRSRQAAPLEPELEELLRRLEVAVGFDTGDPT